MRFVVLAVIFLLAGVVIVAHAAPAGPPAGILKKGSEPRIEMDLDGDGRIDYVLVNTSGGLPEHEEFDYNHDGAMDDFVYYERGVPVREEIDSDFNGKIDIWVYLVEGKFIRRWERDLDGDGKPETFKDF
jgi:hypothetical protein